MEADKVRLFLADHPFAHGLSTLQQETILRDAQTLKFPAGSYLFQAGEHAGKFYIIRTGRVELQTRCPDRGVLTIEDLGPKSMLGWSWLVPPHEWQFDARTIEPTDLIVFEADRLRGLITQDHELGYEMVSRFLGVVVNRLQATRAQLVARQTAGLVTSR